MVDSPRRKEIIRTLQTSKTPLSGTVLGEKLGVSRQIIVHDIALLRTAAVSYTHLDVYKRQIVALS